MGTQNLDPGKNRLLIILHISRLCHVMYLNHALQHSMAQTIAQYIFSSCRFRARRKQWTSCFPNSFRFPHGGSVSVRRFLSGLATQKYLVKILT